MLRFISTLLAILIFIIPIKAQVFEGTTGPIRDDGVHSDFYANVSGLTPAALSTDHGLKSVCINMTHTWIADLDVRIIAPDGRVITLTSGLGGDTDFYDHTCFRMDATDHIFQAAPPFTGNYKPFSNIGNLNNGQDGNGQWIMRLQDTYAFADAGEVLGWQLYFEDNAPGPDVFASSKLPLIQISTQNFATIPDQPKIAGTMKVIDNGPGQENRLTDAPALDVHIGIEVRGASSQSFPKKNYGFETWDEFGFDIDTTILGLPSESDWILYGPFTDKTFLRDALTYKLGNELGQYASRTVFTELWLNDDYQGIYCLEEKIKRDNDRVDIAKLNPEDTSGDELTGGYILKVDRDDGDGSYFVSQYEGTDPNYEIRVVYEDPEGPEMHPAQRQYIQDFYYDFEDALFGDEFENELTGYRRYIDVPSFVEHFIITELGHNVDGYRLSTFLYKDKNSKDSLFHLGPLWDFNLAYGNANYCNCQSVEGWAYEDSGACGNTPKWWPRLLEDPFFQDAVQCRYKELRKTILSVPHITHYIDSMALVFNEAAERNYTKWPILGLWIWPNSFIGQTFEEEIDYMKYWIIQRLFWMDEHLPGKCFISVNEEIQDGQFMIYPNPAKDEINISLFGKSDFTGQIKLTDAKGRVVMNQSVKGYSSALNISHLVPGMYYVTLVDSGNQVYRQKIVVVR